MSMRRRRRRARWNIIHLLLFLSVLYIVLTEARR